MRVFVSEYLVGGACGGLPVAESMRREGLLMLRAVVEDLARLPGYSVVTTLEVFHDVELPATILKVVTADDEGVIFQRLIREVDAVLVIAPETDGILAARCRAVREAGASSWNCTPAAIELCGDKLALADFLVARDIRTIPTKLAMLTELPETTSFPLVLKPRDGAGSTQTWLVRGVQEWQSAASEMVSAGFSENSIQQPYVAGRSLSVGVNLSFDGRRVEVLPIAEQQLSTDGRFCYLGGVIPAELSAEDERAVNDIVVRACQAIPGLAGYVGFDLQLDAEGRPWIVEINPRLTTSYVGYRAGFSVPIPSRWIAGGDDVPAPEFDSLEPIRFTVETR